MDGKVLPAYGITPAVNPTMTTPSNVHQRSTATIENFRKTICRNPTHFNVFNDKRLWARWKLEFKATTCAQEDLNDILNPNYRPGTPDEKEIFNATKQQYLYAVFVRTLTTDKGKTLVRQHVSDYDAQSIYKSLSDFHSNSVHSLQTCWQRNHDLPHYFPIQRQSLGRKDCSLIHHLFPGATLTL